MENIVHLRRKTQVTFNKNYFENLAWSQNRVVVGIDEVGRGGLAGPVVTAAVILPPGATYRHLKDSKLMTPEERVKASKWIKKHCSYGIGIIHHRLINERNIWHATLLAMKKALIHVLAHPHGLGSPMAILVDAMPLNLLDTAYKAIPVHYFPIGERKSTSIAAASILAKVTRDELMRKMGGIFPGYNLEGHKGYSTPAHKKAVSELRHSIIHRVQFVERNVYQVQLQNDQEVQQSLLMMGNEDAGSTTTEIE